MSARSTSAKAPVSALAPDTGSLEFVEIPIEDFVRGKSVDFDIYIRLENEHEGEQRSNHYVKLARGVDDLGQERIQSFRDKGIHHLYLTTEDFNKYLSFEAQVIAAAAQSNIPLQKKMRLVRVTLDILQKKFFHCELKEDDFRLANHVVENTVLVLGTMSDGAALIESLQGVSDDFYAHSSAVSMLSTMIAKKLHWTSTTALRKIAMAGLFHDIGKRDFPKEILKISRDKLTEGQLKLYETHPIFGAEILKRSKIIPIDVVHAVLQHHEYLDGSGFPSGLRQGKIQPIALILAVADEFMHQFLDHSNRGKEDIETILNNMVMNSWQKFAGEAIIALYELFEIEMGANFKNKLVRGGLNII